MKFSTIILPLVAIVAKAVATENDDDKSLTGRESKVLFEIVEQFWKIRDAFEKENIELKDYYCQVPKTEVKNKFNNSKDLKKQVKEFSKFLRQIFTDKTFICEDLIDNFAAKASPAF